MNYYLDNEFLEGTQKKRFLGIPYGETKPTIDLISIGIVSEDDREYYAISKDFNLWEAWNRFDEKANMNYKPTFGGGSDGHYNPKFIKEYWIRENVLKPVWVDLKKNQNISDRDLKFTYKSLKKLLNKYGKSNKEIAEDIIEFTDHKKKRYNEFGEFNLTKPEFYAYYADYDWVAFCWLFGRMIDLPKGFPMYTKDLKQLFDYKVDKAGWRKIGKLDPIQTKRRKHSNKEKEQIIKLHEEYPKQVNEHNALADAKWNKKLHEFIGKYL